MNRPSNRRGLTLIELLVVVSIIGILVALLLPAIQSAREASRRIQCVNNMKNIGLGIHNAAQNHDGFPTGAGSPANTSYLVQVLPFVEQIALFNSININEDVLRNENITALNQAPKVFFCPSDTSRVSVGATNSVNFAGNSGRSVIDGGGVFIARRLAARDILDGLSNTVGVSEWIAGPGAGSVHQRNASKYQLKAIYPDSPEGIIAFTLDCASLSEDKIKNNYISPSKGQFWLAGNLANTLYNHTLQPNLPSCRADQSMDATTASSYHSGGLNVLTMDGCVHFVKDTIDQRVWAAAGSRAGGEADITLE